jgi:hypothetical protein
MLFVGAGIVALSKDSEIQRVLVDAFGSFAADFITGIGVGFIIVGVIALIVTYLLWKGIKLGWYLALIFLAINAVVGILSLWSGLLSLLISALLIWYFLRPSVREFFGT